MLGLHVHPGSQLLEAEWHPRPSRRRLKPEAPASPRLPFTALTGCGGSYGHSLLPRPMHTCAPTRARRLWNWRVCMMKCNGSQSWLTGQVYARQVYARRAPAIVQDAHAGRIRQLDTHRGRPQQKENRPFLEWRATTAPAPAGTVPPTRRRAARPLFTTRTGRLAGPHNRRTRGLRSRRAGAFGTAGDRPQLCHSVGGVEQAQWQGEELDAGW
jgi:hypothetical protein